MDANGLRFWQLADASHWELSPTSSVDSVTWDASLRALTLANEREGLVVPEDTAAATDQLAVIPRATDSWGNEAAVRDTDAGPVVEAVGVLPTPTQVWPPEDLDPDSDGGRWLADNPGAAITDLAVGQDGILTLATGGDVLLVDLRRRWRPSPLTRTGFNAWRVAPTTDGAFVLGVGRRRLVRWTGTPWSERPFVDYQLGVFRPEPENIDAPRLEPVAVLPEDGVALATSPSGELAVLCWTDDGAEVHLFSPEGEEAGVVRLLGVTRPFSIAWTREDRVAVLVVRPTPEPDRVAEAPVYRVDALAREAGEADPVGDLHPIRGHSGGPFTHTTQLPPQFPRVGGSHPLRQLSLPTHARTGFIESERGLDSRDDTTVWHRLYVEARIPRGCGVVVELATSADGRPPVDEEAWFPHEFGPAARSITGAPKGTWYPEPSELPLHEGVLGCEPEPGVAGLWSVLVQRTTRAVRALRGRQLHVRLRLVGNGRATPQVAAIRAYGSRFSYVQRYLPELYQETRFGADADAGSRAEPESATRADFLERFLATFESVLTPLEDKVAASWLVTHPQTVPEESLSWLASWVGVSFDAAHTTEMRRELLAQAPRLSRERGTIRGLERALDIVTCGGITSKHVIVLEDWRLRRTFATILGADLADEEDPLTVGVVVSGNSVVGDTLILGEEHHDQLMSLYAAELRTASEGVGVRAFYDRLAHRVSILVHEDLDDATVARIQRMSDALVPVHVRASILRTTPAFMVGLSSLVGVDTYLRAKPQPQGVRLGHTILGGGDQVRRPASLDPRLEGGTRS